MTEKIQKIIDEISNLTVVELNDLVKSLEEKFGVAMPVFQAGPVASTASAGEEEKSSSVDVILVDSGANKINVIKVIREINPNISLKDAKDMVDNPPQKIAEKVESVKAEELKKKFEEAGAKVELK
ncbi:MAG: 50S ribosomal protein L7/L12 [Candidatus Parcubacteria bacterium]|nr:MAG: 50S ribosomal protein L7/L12 [Candidatus Parcubacteria bacterium]